MFFTKTIEFEIIELIINIIKTFLLTIIFIYLKYLFADINLNFFIFGFFKIEYIKKIIKYKRTILNLKYSPIIIPIIYPIAITTIGLFSSIFSP